MRLASKSKWVALAAVGALTLAACGGSDSETSSEATTEAVEETTAEEAPAETTEEAEAPAEPIGPLRYAFFAPAQSFPGLQMELWSERLGEETNGQVTTELFPGGTLLGSGDIFDGVTQGVAEVGLDSPAYDVGRFPAASVINMPLGFMCARSASATLLELLTEFQPEEFADYEIITAFTTEPAYLQTQEPVTTTADLQGLELRTSGALTSALSSLGAAPVGLPMPEVSQALETGVIKGYVSSREVLKDFGLSDQVSYVTNYPFAVSNSFVGVMDKAYFDSLPANVQDSIRGLSTEMMEWTSNYHDAENVGIALEEAQGKGVEIVEVDDATKAEWDAAMQAQIDEWLATNADAGFDAQAVLDRALELAQTNNSLCS